ncbi:MAG: hypothetical protein IPM81_05195 [Saprospirales bacterium]|nr:hypothetical protein [Saprospirales bacterium]
MKKTITFLAISALLTLAPWRLAAQEKKAFEHSFLPQLMTRAEYLHGYQTLAQTDAKPGFFISQRTRLTYKLSHEHFEVAIAPQDVRVWGASSHLSPDTSGSLSLAEGYGVIKFNVANRLKAGRQIIQYDEHRILGSLDWGMQSRRHDLLLFQHDRDTVLSFHLGAAWNQDKANPTSTVYQLKNHYKTLQFLWLFRKWRSSNLSFLFLNNGFQFSKTTTPGAVENSTVFNQTLGFNSNFQLGKLRFLTWAYFQTGKNASSKNAAGDPKKIAAFNAALDVNYKPLNAFYFNVGGEYLSGTSQDAARQDKAYAFNPFYGTNHRFNGYMDYFFVGNHVNNVGLLDAYLKINFQRNNLGPSSQPPPLHGGRRRAGP